MCKEQEKTKYLKDFGQKCHIGQDHWEGPGCDKDIKFWETWVDLVPAQEWLKTRISRDTLFGEAKIHLEIVWPQD